jgi:hypothetical protein
LIPKENGGGLFVGGTREGQQPENNWRKIAITPTMRGFAIVGEIARFRQLSRIHLVRGLAWKIENPL